MLYIAIIMNIFYRMFIMYESLLNQYQDFVLFVKYHYQKIL